MVNSIPKYKVPTPTRVESPFTVVVSENIFSQGIQTVFSRTTISYRL